MANEQPATGVVLVHGIGISQQGDTLTRWAMPILAQLGIKAEDATVRLREDPASLSFDATGAKGPISVVLVESWWEELFSAPPFLEFVKWSWRSVPMTIVAHFDEKFRRVTNNVEKSLAGQKPVAIVALFLELFVLLFGLLLVPVVLAMLVVLTSLYAVPQFRGFVQTVQSILTSTVGDSMVFARDGLLRETIIEKVRGDIKRVAEASSDCIVLAHSQGAAVAHLAIRRILDSDEETQKLKSSITFVSFGSGVRKLTELHLNVDNHRGRLMSLAVTASALVAGCLVGGTAFWLPQPFVPTFWLVSFSMLVCSAGLGLRMLGYSIYTHNDSDKDTERASSIANWLGLLAILIMTVASAVYSPASRLSIGADVWIAVPVLLGLAFTLLMEWRYKVGRKTHVGDQKKREGELWKKKYQIGSTDWVDLYATFDPVPNGPLMDHHVVGTYRPVQVVNALSPIKDHDTKSYFKKDSLFLTEVAAIIRGNRPDESDQPPPLHLTSPHEILFRGLSLISVGVWLWVTLDGMVLQRIREAGFLGNYLRGCNPISHFGEDSGYCVEVGMFEGILVAATPIGIAILSFVVPVFFTLLILRKWFSRLMLKERSTTDSK